MYNDLNADIKNVTHQKDDIRIICYQSSTITKGLRYTPNNYDATEPRTPTAQMELIRDDSLIWVSGPTYPYDFVNESLHIDAIGQQSIGTLAADLNVPCPPLCFDTIHVKKADNFGFNVIRPDGADVVSDVMIDNNSVVIRCTESPDICKLRYGINGEFLKGGRNVGPRGNLRDSQKTVPNWCLIFETFIGQ